MILRRIQYARMGCIVLVALGACIFFYSRVRAMDQNIVIEVLPLGTPEPSPTPSPTPSPSASPTPTHAVDAGGGPAPQSHAHTQVTFSGHAYPHSTVVLLKDAQMALETVAGPDSDFSVSLSGLSSGSYMFSIYGEDTRGRRSGAMSFPVTITSGALTTISGIFIAPTLDIDKTQVKQGDTLLVFGRTISDAQVTIQVNSDKPSFFKTSSDSDGAYAYRLDTADLAYGQHYLKSKTIKDTAVSPTSQTVGFVVGSTNVKKLSSVNVENDLDSDGRVNLVDFSIMAYWYKRPLTPEAMTRVDFNHDGKVNLVEFSILAYYWTG